MRTLVLSAKQSRSIYRVNQLHSEDQAVFKFDYPSCYYCPYVESSANLLWIKVFAPVSQDSAQCHDAQSGQLGKMADNALSDPITDVLSVRITTNNRQGQNSYRINRPVGRRVFGDAARLRMFFFWQASNLIWQITYSCGEAIAELWNGLYILTPVLIRTQDLSQ